VTIQTVIEQLAHEYAREQGEDYDDAVLRYYVREYLDSDSPATSAWLASAQERYTLAASLWRTAARQHPKALWMRVELARAQASDGPLAEAIETFRHALDSLKQRDRDWAVRSYETRALWQYSIAIIDLRMGDTVAGREALERTVLEDRTYYPAYVRLAVLN